MAPSRCTLHIDDDHSTNYLNRKLLERLAVAAQVQVGHNGQEALEVLATACTTPDAPAFPALIFLDINMPIMNGFQFLEAYGQLPLAQQGAVVIIMLTTSLHPRDVQRAGALPAAKIAQVLADYFPDRHGVTR